MHRAEVSFRALSERIEYLEQRQAWQGPSDEQVERVLRKILAERFADAGIQQVENPNVMKEGDYFVKRPGEDSSIPRTIPIDPATLLVDPDAVPSKTYAQTFQMLEKGLGEFPRADVGKPAQRVSDLDKDDSDFKRPQAPTHSTQTKPW